MAGNRAESDERSEPLTSPVELSPDGPESDAEFPVPELPPDSEGSAPAPPGVGPPLELSGVSGLLNPGGFHP